MAFEPYRKEPSRRIDTTITRSIDDALPTEEDLKDLQKCHCLNCHEKFSVHKQSMFTRTGPDQEMIFWHVAHCNASHYM